jgi:archaemetzincin
MPNSRYQCVAAQPTLLVFVVAIVFCPLFSCTCEAQSSGNSPVSDRPLSVSQVKRTIRSLKSLDEKIPDPKPGEWLDQHKEKGQLFSKYTRIRPNVLSRERGTLYIQPIGWFSETEKRLMKSTANYLKVYFNCQVKTLADIDPATIPASARRKHPQWGDEQLLTSHILDKILKPNLPKDAFATIAFTQQDLWPGDGWNFVFGFAAYRERVGVWSLYRFGDPEESEETYRKCLLRMIKLATHETGHMFSMRHCTHARCNMQGSNSLEESDEQPLHLCSECHGKTIYAIGADPTKRFKALKSLCDQHGFKAESKHYATAIEKLDR